LTNAATAPVFIGNSGVTTTTGYQIPASGSVLVMFLAPCTASCRPRRASSRTLCPPHGPATNNQLVEAAQP
jgi:hypothetical protein